MAQTFDPQHRKKTLCYNVARKAQISLGILVWSEITLMLPLYLYVNQKSIDDDDDDESLDCQFTELLDTADCTNELRRLCSDCKTKQADLRVWWMYVLGIFFYTVYVVWFFYENSAWTFHLNCLNRACYFMFHTQCQPYFPLSPQSTSLNITNSISSNFVCLFVLRF